MNVKPVDTASFLQRGRRQHITWCSRIFLSGHPPRLRIRPKALLRVVSHLRTIVRYTSLFNTMQFYSCFFSNETFCNILVVHSFFTFYLNLVLSRPVRKAFKISSVCWTKALLKGRLLLGGLRSVFLDFDSFITCEESMKMLKIFDSCEKQTCFKPLEGVRPIVLGDIF